MRRTAGFAPRSPVRVSDALTLLAVLALGCGEPTPLPPRVAQALGGQPHGCGTTCSVGSWCDPETGRCVSGASSTSTTSAHRDHASETEAAPDPGLAFDCVTRSGLEDDIVASDIEAAEHACAALDGEPCRCRPADGSATE